MTIKRDAERSDAYTDKLLKILPAELTAVYFLLRTLAGEDPNLSVYLIVLAFVLCGAFYVIAPQIINMNTFKNRILYCITFLLWVNTIDQYRIATDVIRLNQEHIAIFAFLASGFAAIWSFAVPYLMDKGEV